ncbi:TetR/AcrR family transcriptional regulator [Rhodococcus spelaei]|uniref:TetR/AcrR family transcriptional regulator n=1 Tax=Rhodococcus spelaei TaxID=2546320 RepID=A0A541BNR9_9NOCA|nr:ScbR family autoregulator-binding transcription factor [Rhodococcus spelaei]TQF73962.1 TetR/AcrR family transcriptional regulator [Rhodococcus spelaei]
MARQERAEATRNAVLLAAAEVFARLGYAQANLSEIVAQSGATKGSLYFHFASKEDLARGVIDEGTRRLGVACAPLVELRNPALETMIGLSYLAADVAAADPIVAAMYRLHHEVGDHRGTGDNVVETWQEYFVTMAERAIDEGDVAADSDARDVGMFIFEALFGARVVAHATGTLDQLNARTERAWHFILPSLVAAGKIDYFREFAVRRSRR